MNDSVTIKGGATDFEAGVIAVVLDQIELEAKAAKRRAAEAKPTLSPWVSAVRLDESQQPFDPWNRAP